MKKFCIAFSLLLLSGWAAAEPLKTVFNPFTGKQDYITRIDSNTVLPGANCTSTSNSNGTVTISCTGGGSGGTTGTVNPSPTYEAAIYSLPGSSTAVTGSPNFIVTSSSVGITIPVTVSTMSDTALTQNGLLIAGAGGSLITTSTLTYSNLGVLGHNTFNISNDAVEDQMVIQGLESFIDMNSDNAAGIAYASRNGTTPYGGEGCAPGGCGLFNAFGGNVDIGSTGLNGSSYPHTEAGDTTLYTATGLSAGTPATIVVVTSSHTVLISDRNTGSTVYNYPHGNQTYTEPLLYAVFTTTSSTRGSIPCPVMTTTQLNAIPVSAAYDGLCVYDSVAEKEAFYNATTSAWVYISTGASGGTGTSPGGSDTQVQYNSAGIFAGSSSLVFDGTYTKGNFKPNSFFQTQIGYGDSSTAQLIGSNSFTYDGFSLVTIGDPTTGTAPVLNMSGPAGPGGEFFIHSAGNSDGSGGSVNFVVTLSSFNITAATTTFSGKVIVASTATFNGNVNFSSGVYLNSTTGTNGQVFTSGGPGTIPSWTTVSGSGGGSSPLETMVNGVRITSPTATQNFIAGAGISIAGSVPATSTAAVTVASVLKSSGVAFGSALNNVTQDTNTFIYYDAFLPQPQAPTITPVGTTGSKIYFYTVVPLGNLGYGRSSTYTTISNSNNTLSGTNYNTVQTFAVPGATSCDLFRSPDLNTAPTGNYIFIQNVSCGASYNDVGTSPGFSGTVGEGGFTLTDQSAGLLVQSNAVITQSLTVGTTQVAVTPEGSSGTSQFSVYQVLVGSSSPVSDPTLVSLNYVIDPNGYGVNQPWIMQNTLAVPSSNSFNIPAIEGISNNVNDNGTGTLGSGDSIIGNLFLGPSVTQPIASVTASNFTGGNFSVTVSSAIKSGPTGVLSTVGANGTGGTVSRMYDYRATMAGAPAGQTITNAFSYYASTPSANGMTNYEGMRLEDGHSFGTNSSYGLHVSGKNWNSLFDGSVIAGTETIIGSNLNVNGVNMAWPSTGTIGGFLQYISTNTVQWATPAGGGGGITALTGDVTASGTGSVAATAAAAQPNITTLNSTSGVTISSNALISGSTFYKNGPTVLNGTLGIGGAVPTAAITLPGSGNTINSLGDISIRPAGLIQETAGNGILATNAGSSINFQTGTGNTTGGGGAYIVTAGAGGNAGNGGSIQFQAGRGNGLNTNAGDIIFQGARSGNTGSGNGTNIRFEPGNSTAGSVGTLQFYDASLGDYAYFDMTNITNDNPSIVALTLPSVNGTLMTQESASTGAGAALLGANSPASTLTAPATWIKVRLPDDTDAYIPVWK